MVWVFPLTLALIVTFLERYLSRKKAERALNKRMEHYKKLDINIMLQTLSDWNKRNMPKEFDISDKDIKEFEACFDELINSNKVPNNIKKDIIESKKILIKYLKMGLINQFVLNKILWDAVVLYGLETNNKPD